ncbi:hypothetical protein Scep_020001 [Stephania cephalantha]|uniref:non-specific serine/threonine protein kinase n=1 Tax=Stephania cephalantha TaxID=152367 RepID=A0AAP0IC28_9MAGN
MGCFSCLCGRRKDVRKIKDDSSTGVRSSTRKGRSKTSTENVVKKDSSIDKGSDSSTNPKRGGARSFTFRELAAATKNFKEANLIGQGGFGKVYKGILETGQTVAIKQLDHNGLQGNREFIIEVLMLSLLHHSNLVTLIGYCTDGDQRLLAYEYMPMGCLEDHLFDLTLDKASLDWNTRIKIAVGAAQGLEYLHCKADPPVIYRDLKSANILLDDDFNPKLSDFGLAKLGPVGDNTHVSTRVMGTHGYCAPEYAMSVVAFRAVSRPFFKDRRRFAQLADPLLEGRFPVRCFHHAIAITAMCLQEQPNFRPLIGDVVVALEYLASQPYQSEAQTGCLRSHPSSPAQRGY